MIKDTKQEIYTGRVERSTGKYNDIWEFNDKRVLEDDGRVVKTFPNAWD